MEFHMSYQPPAPTDYNQQPVNQYGSERTNVLAIVSLVSAFFISLVAIITGHIALSQIKRTGEKGRGLALAGLILGYVGILLFFVVIVGAIGSAGKVTTNAGPTAAQPVAPPAVTAPPVLPSSPAAAPSAAPSVAPVAPSAAPQPTQEPADPQVSVGEQNAVDKAQGYLGILGFSRSGLIKQLKFDGFSTAEATYGVEHSGANWNEQAAKKAKEYLDVMAFSRSGLIAQLKFDGFTSSQAAHGASAAGL